MSKHEFTLILGMKDEGEFDLEAAADSLFEAGCDDGTLSISNGVVSMDFIREAESLEAAITSAITDAGKSTYPLKVLRVEGLTPEQAAKFVAE